MILGTLIKTTASFWLLIGFFSGSNYEIDPLEQSLFFYFSALVPMWQPCQETTTLAGTS